MVGASRKMEIKEVLHLSNLGLGRKPSNADRRGAFQKLRALAYEKGGLTPLKLELQAKRTAMAAVSKSLGTAPEKRNKLQKMIAANFTVLDGFVGTGFFKEVKDALMEETVNVLSGVELAATRGGKPANLDAQVEVLHNVIFTNFKAKVIKLVQAHTVPGDHGTSIIQRMVSKQ